ncbi:MAG TPA: hypothetical protein VNU19_22515 [Candidatus Acidoferrum sp.]|nr:hypothetical protein [Candidatus Acidoferrum sp.]
MSALRRGLRAFGKFWLDFLIGDTPEIFVGTLVVVGCALGLRHQRAIAMPLIIVATVFVFVMSTYRGRVRTEASTKK